jgi:CRP-like cAMP-binding protein
MNLDQTLANMARKFRSRTHIDDADREALMRLPFQQRAVESGRYVVREGTRADECILIPNGFAIRHKLTEQGDRQIVSIHIPGDFVDLEGALLNTADHNVQTLTRCDIATIPRTAILKLIDEHPRIARAMWVDTLVDSSIFREWILNVGRRSARQRIAHIMCELGRRLEFAGLAEAGGFEFPTTQEQLGDATGLTSVHVNRTIKSLEADGLIVRERRFLKIPEWERLRDRSGFNEIYLHLDQAA